MKRNPFIILLASVLVLGGVIGGAFIGGMTIGKNQGREEAIQELQSRASQLTPPSGQDRFQPGTPPLGLLRPGGLLGGRETAGTVEKVEGNIITLKTPDGTVRILVADNTSIQRMAEGNLSDISPGNNITVSGEHKEDGSIQARTIFMTPALDTQ